MRLVTDCVKESAGRRFRRRHRYVGVDEISYGRGQNNYLTIVWDHEAGHVVWIDEGREQETLEQFFASSRLAAPAGSSRSPWTWPRVT